MKKKLRVIEIFKWKALPKVFLLLTGMAIISTTGFSQQISADLLSTGGETFTTENQSLEFAVGEVATETYQLGNRTLAQGFYQGTVDIIDFIRETEKDMTVRVFPNPCNGKLTINYDTAPAYIEVIDLRGRIVFTIRHPEKPEVLNLKNLRNGIYLLRMVFEGDTPVTKRIIKN